MTGAIAVVGAGLIGTAIAYELAKRGANVTLFDRAHTFGAASWAGAGMLAPFSEEMPDAALLALCRGSLEAYPAFVQELRERTGLDAHLLHHGTLHVALDATEEYALAARGTIYARNGGDVVLLDRAETLEREAALSRTACGSLFIANEAQIDNRRLGRALTAGCRMLGVGFEQVETLALEIDPRRVRGLHTERGFVPVDRVVNAGGAWAGTLAGVPHDFRAPVFPVAGEMLALAVPPSFARALVRHEHTYLVPRGDGRLLVGATVVERGFDSRVTAKGMHALLDAALRIAPSLGNFAVVESWAGLRPGSRDGRPFLGATGLEGYFIAAGHYRNGILLAPITARALADVILDGCSAVDLRPFSLDRNRPESDKLPANATLS